MSKTIYITCKKCSQNISWEEIENDNSPYNIKGICQKCSDDEE